MSKVIKTIKAELNLDVNKPEDKQEFEKIIKQNIASVLSRDEDCLNLIKIDIDESYFVLNQFMESIADMLKRQGITNFVVVPIGDRVGIKDITVDKVEVIHESCHKDETRIIKKFLLLPRKIGTERKWLKTVYIIQAHKIFGYDGDMWFDVRWSTKEEYEIFKMTHCVSITQQQIDKAWENYCME